MQIKQHIPNILTLCNLVSGAIAWTYLNEQNIALVTILLGIALLMDFVDGLVARWLGVTSELGKQLDSLADMVSFGVVPGMIMMLLIQKALQAPFPPTALSILPLTALMIPVFSAIRLGKFNLDNRQIHRFYGLPTPAHALLILSYWLIVEFQPGSWLAYLLSNVYVLITLMLISSVLLISNIPLFSFKFQNYTLKDNGIKYLLLALGGVGFALFEFSAIPMVIVLYILFSVLGN